MPLQTLGSPVWSPFEMERCVSGSGYLWPCPVGQCILSLVVICLYLILYYLHVYIPNPGFLVFNCLALYFNNLSSGTKKSNTTNQPQKKIKLKKNRKEPKGMTNRIPTPPSPSRPAPPLGHLPFPFTLVKKWQSCSWHNCSPLHLPARQGTGITRKNTVCCLYIYLRAIRRCPAGQDGAWLLFLPNWILPTL